MHMVNDPRRCSSAVERTRSWLASWLLFFLSRTLNGGRWTARCGRPSGVNVVSLKLGNRSQLRRQRRSVQKEIQLTRLERSRALSMAGQTGGFVLAGLVAANGAVAQPVPAETRLTATALSRPLTVNERREQDRIAARIAPNGLGDGRVPPRDIPGATFYSAMPDEELWTHLLYSRQIAVIGIKDRNARRGYFAGKSLVSPAALQRAQTEVLRMPGVAVAVVEPLRDLQLPMMPDGCPYPAIIVKLERAALARIRALDYVDFVEPLYPEIEYLDVGCDPLPYAISASDQFLNAITYALSASDPILIVAGTPNLVPWSFAHHAIREAWGLFPAGTTAPGFGVDFFETDTGVYRSQRQFWELFSPSTTPVPRSFSEFVWGGDALVACSHGTRIAGLAAAPADASTPLNVVGIAWGSSLRSLKIGDGVIKWKTPSTAVANAILEAANDTTILPLRKRVLLMAWGMPPGTGSHVIRAAIETAYDSNPNLIIVAAAGTAADTVVFPANMCGRRSP